MVRKQIRPHLLVRQYKPAPGFTRGRDESFDWRQMARESADSSRNTVYTHPITRAETPICLAKGPPGQPRHNQQQQHAHDHSAARQRQPAIQVFARQRACLRSKKHQWR